MCIRDSCITGIAKHLDDDVLNMLDIVLRLATLRFGNPQAHEAITEILLNTKIALSRHGGDK